MKHYIALLLCLISSLGYAKKIDLDLCPSLLNVVIQNDTQVDCYMTYQTINKGTARSSAIPLMIPAGKKSSTYGFETEIMPLQWADELSVGLSFQCGADKTVTFESRKYVYAGVFSPSISIEGSVTALSNMDANFMIISGDCAGPHPKVDTLRWILY